VLWGAVAVLLAWSLGAYNRLVRLRARVIRAFAPVDHRLGQAMVLLPQGPTASDQPSDADEPEGDTGAHGFVNWAGLSAAATQLEHSLRIARRQPLDASAMAALRTAYATVHAVWQRQHGDASDTWPAIAPVLDQRAWEDNTQVAREAMETLNHSVTAYNSAIAQFPALLLAYLFGFGPAACL